MKEYKYDLNHDENCAIISQTDSCFNCIDKNDCKHFSEYINPLEVECTLSNISKEIESKKNEIQYLENVYDNMFDINETLKEYYSEVGFLKDEISEREKIISYLNKLIYLEECGIDTKKELNECACDENKHDKCEAGKFFGLESCKDCEFIRDTYINKRYNEEYSKMNINDVQLESTPF